MKIPKEIKLLLLLLIALSSDMYAETLFLMNVRLKISLIATWLIIAIILIMKSIQYLPKGIKKYMIYGAVGFGMLIILVGAFMVKYTIKHQHLIFMDEIKKTTTNLPYREEALNTFKSYILAEIILVLSVSTISYKAFINRKKRKIKSQ